VARPTTPSLHLLIPSKCWDTEIRPSLAGWSRQLAQTANDKPLSTSPASWLDAVHTRVYMGKKKWVQLCKHKKIGHMFIWSQRPRKSPPAVIFTSRETPSISLANIQTCSVHIACIQIYIHFSNVYIFISNKTSVRHSKKGTWHSSLPEAYGSSVAQTQLQTALCTVLLHKHSVPHSIVYSSVAQTQFHIALYTVLLHKLSSSQHCVQFCCTNSVPQMHCIQFCCTSSVPHSTVYSSVAQTQFHTALYAVPLHKLSSTQHCIQFRCTNSVPHSTVYSSVTQTLSSTHNCIVLLHKQFQTALYTVLLNKHSFPHRTVHNSETQTLSSTQHCIQFCYTNTQVHTTLYTVLLHKHSIPNNTVYSFVTQTLSSTQHYTQFC
jgi:hypothetical protein